MYTWSPVGTNPSAMCAGTYGLTVTDSNGATATASITITEPAALSVTVSQTNVSCYGGCDGTATLSASGGVPPYSYYPIGPNPAALGVGTYVVTIVDANNCTAITSFTITGPSPITDIISSTGDDGTGNGTATINVSGGTPSYNYQWDDPLSQTTPIATGLNAGLYHITVTDSNGCTIIDSVYVIITGISSEIISNSFNLFPNPANTLINLNISTNKSKEITIIIYNNIGDVVLRKDMVINSGNNSHTFDVRQFAFGLYFVKLQKNNDISYIKFIKKQ